MIILVIGVITIAATLVGILTSNYGPLNTHDSLSLRSAILIFILILGCFTAGIALVVRFRCLCSTLDCIILSLGIIT